LALFGSRFVALGGARRRLNKAAPPFCRRVQSLWIETRGGSTDSCQRQSRSLEDRGASCAKDVGAQLITTENRRVGKGKVVYSKAILFN